MGITGYTAMTATEFFSAASHPRHPAWMACHFSCYGTGLTNLPQSLPEGAMVIVNDCIPMQGHDPAYILTQLNELLEKLKPDCILLDFQRPYNADVLALVKLLTASLPCPVGVSELYAMDLPCPVFVSAPPVDRMLKAHLAPWEGREIWLEVAEDAQTATVSEDGCTFSPAGIEITDETFLLDQEVHCAYRVELTPEAAVFHLRRSKAELHELLTEAETLKIPIAVGLYQQLGTDFFKK